MPNYKLSSAVIEEIKCRARNLTERRVAYAQAGFPLTPEQIQEASINPETLALARRLDRIGYRGINKDTSLTIGLCRSTHPELTRSVALSVALPKPVYVARTTYWDARSTSWTPGDNKDLHMLQGLDAADSEALAGWANRVVREKRTAQLVMHTVENVLRNCVNTGDIMATWPVLATLVRDDFWRGRLRCPPLKLDRYAPSTALIERYGREMQASAVVLSSAELLEPFKPPAGVIQAFVPAWERLPNDKRYDQ